MEKAKEVPKLKRQGSVDKEERTREREEEKKKAEQEKETRKTIRDSQRAKTKEEALPEMRLIIDDAAVVAKRGKGLELLKALREVENLNVEINHLPLPRR